MIAKTITSFRIGSHKETVIPAGTSFLVTFNNGDKICTLHPMDRTDGIPFMDIKIPCGKLHNLFAEIERPSIQDLWDAFNTGSCPSILGERVEPDGWDSEGSPSWMIALGLI